MGGQFGEDSLGVLTALAGYNQLAYGDAASALESFRQVVLAHPEEILGWEGLRSAAEAVGDRGTLAEACAALGDAVSDASQGSEFWERAALILLDEFQDVARGEFALLAVLLVASYTEVGMWLAIAIVVVTSLASVRWPILAEPAAVAPGRTAEPLPGRTVRPAG